MHLLPCTKAKLSAESDLLKVKKVVKGANLSSLLRKPFEGLKTCGVSPLYYFYIVRLNSRLIPRMSPELKATLAGCFLFGSPTGFSFSTVPNFGKVSFVSSPGRV